GAPRACGRSHWAGLPGRPGRRAPAAEVIGPASRADLGAERLRPKSLGRPPGPTWAPSACGRSHWAGLPSRPGRRAPAAEVIGPASRADLGAERLRPKSLGRPPEPTYTATGRCLMPLMK